MLCMTFANVYFSVPWLNRTPPCSPNFWLAPPEIFNEGGEAKIVAEIYLDTG